MLQTRTEPAVAPTVTMSTVRLPITGSNRLPLNTRLEEFEITGVIGEGGFGIVYTAHDHSLERDIAIKEYMPSGLAARVDGTTVAVLGEDSLETFHSGLRSFVNEAKLLARFDHPSLLKVYRFWEGNGTAYMAMPHYKGETLKQRLRRTGAPDEAWLRAMLMQLLAALDVIHAEHCYHRDIAPDNIFLIENDRPVLLDFGAARRVISDKTHALTVILKPGFAPLEQYADVPNLKQGAWTDLYALAAVIYHAITGEKPPPSISRYVSDQMVPLSQRAQGRYSAGFLAAIDQALSVQPSARPQNADEMRALLSREAGAIPPVAPAPQAVVVEQTTRQPVSDRTVTLRPAVDAPSAAVPDVAPAPMPAAVQLPAARSEPSAPAIAKPAELPPVPSSPSRGGTGQAKGASPLLWLGLAVGLVVLVVGVLVGGHLLGPPAPGVAPPPLSQPPTAQPHTAVTSTPANSTPAPAPAPTPAQVPSQAQTPPTQTAAPAPTQPVSQPPPVATHAPAKAPPAVRSPAPAPAEPTTAQRVAQLLSSANASLARKDYGQAGKLADQALALDPHNESAQAIRKKAQQGAWSEVQIQ